MTHGRQLFHDRREAGCLLANHLRGLAGTEPLVLALPRGGVPVAFEIARALRAELDLLMVRKLGAPGQEELGIGALVDGANPQVVLNEDVVRMVAPSQSYIDAETKRQLTEIERRRAAYRGDRPAPDLAGRTIVVVDDGVATGGTMMAALQGIRKSAPKRLVLAVPVAPPEAIERLSRDCDDIVCLATPEPFLSVGLHYQDFSQTSDEEVRELLAAARQFRVEA